MDPSGGALGDNPLETKAALTTSAAFVVRGVGPRRRAADGRSRRAAVDVFGSQAPLGYGDGGATVGSSRSKSPARNACGSSASFGGV